MSRRKHLLQTLEQEVQPPSEGQHIVRAVGSRGSNIIEVEFPDSRSTLCLLPAKFHKKLWIRKGSFLIVEDAPEASSEGQRVTGFVAAVLYADHVKQLRRMPGVWPPEFESNNSGSAGASGAAEQLAAMGLAESDSEGDAAQAAGSSRDGGAVPAGGRRECEQQAQAQQQQRDVAAAPGAAAERTEGEGSEGEYSSSEDDLPPIPRFNNRKVIEYAVSDSDSDED